MKRLYLIIAGIVSALFGLATIFAGGSVIFDLFGMRQEQGNYVLFVVWANFICGFLYLFAAYGFFKTRKWTSKLLQYALYILIITFAGLFIWIVTGHLYETRTIAAMSFRLLVTLILFVIARYFQQRVTIDQVL